jgi:hypothetical protein
VRQPQVLASADGHWPLEVPNDARRGARSCDDVKWRLPPGSGEPRDAAGCDITSTIRITWSPQTSGGVTGRL